MSEMTTILYGQTIQGKAAANWPVLYKICEQFHRFKIEITDRDLETTSDAMMRYWHAMPVKLFAEYSGFSTWQSEQILKSKCGRDIFVKEVKENEKRRGQILFECQYAHCQHLFVLPKKLITGSYVCPKCLRRGIEQIFMLSKTEVPISDFCDVMKNAHDFLASLNINCPMPDPKWRENIEKETVKCLTE